MKWVIKNQDIVQYFDDFNKAVEVFRESVFNYIIHHRNVFYENNVPSDVDFIYSYKCEEGLINDEEIVAFTRLQLLFQTINDDYKGHINKRDIILKTINKEIKLHSEIEEFNESVDISIKPLNNEIVVDLRIDDKQKPFLKTNAFIFDDDKKDYYFKSLLIIRTSSNPEECETPVASNITLTYLSEA